MTEKNLKLHKQYKLLFLNHSESTRKKTILISLTISIFSISMSFAFQDKPNTRDPYERLLETTKEYNLAVAKGDSVAIAENSYLLGKRHIALSDYAEGQKWLLKALRIRERIGNFEDIGKIYMRMQEIQIILGTHQSSAFYARKALFNFQKDGKRRGLMSAYTAVGTSFMHLAKANKDHSIRLSTNPLLDSAIHYFRQSNVHAVPLGFHGDVGENYRHLSNCFIQKGDIRQYEKYVNQAAHIFKSQNFKRNELHLSLDAVDIYLDKSDYSKAEKWLINAENLVKYPEITDNLKQSLHIARARFYATQKYWAKAYFHVHRAYELDVANAQLYGRQSVDGIRKIHDGELKEVELKARQNEVRILQNNAEIQNKMTWAISLLLAVSLMTALFFGILYKKYLSVSRHNALLIREQSHRTKNDLQSVCNLLNLQLFNVSDDATIQVLQESLLRVESMTMVHHQLYQADDLAKINLEHYIKDLVNSVLKIYHKNQIKTIFDIKPCWLSSEKAVSFGLILNELTTNACKYGLNEATAQLTVKCEEREGKISVYFSDNGPGVSPASKGNGFGINLITMLTTQLKATGHFNTEGGFSYTMTIPITDIRKSKIAKRVNDPNIIHEYSH